MTVEKSTRLPALLRLVIGAKISRQHSTNEKLSENQSHLVRAIFPALWASYKIIDGNSHWLMAVLAPFVIGRNNYFSIGFSTIIWKLLFPTYFGMKPCSFVTSDC